MPMLRDAWSLLPEPLRDRLHGALRPSGVPYLVSFLASYRSDHDLSNFAGQLPLLSEQYRSSSGVAKQALAPRFERIVDQLTMANGVRKTTYSERHRRLRELFADERLRMSGSGLAVLDIPASIGLASLDLYRELSQHYDIGSYTLADRYTLLYCDRDRGCLFDEERNLVQKSFKRSFYSLHLPHASGDVFGPVARIGVRPLRWISELLRRRYRFDVSAKYAQIPLIHPDVEPWLAKGVFRLARMDIFEPIDGKFDLILSFNLLQKNYFPPARIAQGMDRLGAALNENGLLIVGNTESFRVYRKWDRELVPIMGEGDF